jgi:hypothetical protein
MVVASRLISAFGFNPEIQVSTGKWAPKINQSGLPFLFSTSFPPVRISGLETRVHLDCIGSLQVRFF